MGVVRSISSRALWRRGVLVAVLLSAVLVLVAPTAAHAATNVTGFTWSSGGTSDWVGQGTSGTLSPPASTFSISGTVGYVTVQIQSTDYWTVDLAAPKGQQLQPGTYSGAERAAFRTPGHPGLDVSGRGHGCNNLSGTFTINAISADAAGRIKVLDAAFTQYCESTANAPLTGTIKYLAPSGPVVVSTDTITTVDGNQVLATANVNGTGPGASGPVVFDLDGVPFATVAPTNGLASYRFVPPVGTHNIRATYAGDATHSGGTASTAVTVFSGSTSFTFDSGAQDYVGQGASVRFSPDIATTQLSGTPSSLSMHVNTANYADWWDARLAAPTGQQLTAGQDYAAERFNTADKAGLDVGGDGRGCNGTTGTIHISSIGTDATGQVNELDATFVQECGQPTDPVLRGRLRFNAGPTTTTALTVDPTSVAIGQPVTLRATVTGSSPSGTVTFYDGTTVIGTSPLDSPPGPYVAVSATLITSNLNPGAHAITASYSGDADDPPSSAPRATVTVIKSSTTTNLTASPASAAPGQPIVLRAAVSSSGAPVPTGVVQFFEGATLVGSSTLSSGAASLSVAPAVGTHTYTATYAGDVANIASTSGAATTTVVPYGSTTSVTASDTAPNHGRAVVLTARVSTGGAAPTGTVTFYDGSTVVGTASVTAGSASISVTFAKGTHTVTATYGGDTSHAGSTSSGITIKAK